MKNVAAFGGICVICIVGGASLLAPTQLDLSKVENRRQIIEERKGIDCGGIYKQTQLKVGAVLRLFKELESSVGLETEKLVDMTVMTTALGQKRREFCEYYKRTPEWNREEYFKAYGEIERQESDVDKILRAIVAEAEGRQKSRAKPLSELLGSLESIPISASDTLESAMAKLKESVTTVPILPEPSAVTEKRDGLAPNLLPFITLALAVPASILGGGVVAAFSRRRTEMLERRIKELLEKDKKGQF